MNRGKVLITSILAISIALLMYWFFTTFERKQETINTGYSAEARRNSMLAAGRMIRLMGLDAKALEPGTWQQQLELGQGTVIVLSGSWTLGKREFEQLLDWVHAGGQILVAPSASPRPRLDWLTGPHENQNKDGPQSVSNAEGDESTEDATLQQQSAGILLEEFGIGRATHAPYSDENALEPMELRALAPGVKVDFESRTRLRSNNPTTQRVLAADKQGACAIEGSYGRGRYVALCSMHVFHNDAIGNENNATFLWKLIAHKSTTEPVWLVFDTDMPPLHLWLWEHIPQTVVCVALALALWLWSATRHSGPLLDIDAPGHRRTLEHIEASGRYMYKHAGPEPLLSAIRSDFIARLTHYHPALARLPDAERYQQIAKLSALGVDEVFRALTVKPRNKSAFVEAVRHLQQLRGCV